MGMELETELIKYVTIRKEYYILRYKLDNVEKYRVFAGRQWLFEGETFEAVKNTLDNMNKY